MQFVHFDTDAFLSDCWQKKPLLIRNPWAKWNNPLEPDELAGMACEEGVESRLITQGGDRESAASRDARENWRPENGPFPEKRFDELGKEPWTLLVQAVDHYVPDVAALIDPFRFVPNWRIDDVMVSYASDGGGVGAHFDQYDVFLVQGLGRRRWQVGAHGEGRCDDTTALLPHDDLRLLAHFEPVEEWLLEPGDILYVPPGVAHNGVAVGDDCMTYSVGFRAPSRSELIGHWSDDLLAEMVDDDRYGDPDLAAQSNPGEISAAALDRLHAMVTQKLADRDAFARWFGGYNSTRKYADMDWRPEEPVTAAQVREALATGAPMLRNPASRFSFVRREGGALLLFVDGECFECAGPAAVFAESLCARDSFPLDPELAASDAAVEALVSLYNQGSVAFDSDD